jgi:hypothetical protein
MTGLRSVALDEGVMGGATKEGRTLDWGQGRATGKGRVRGGMTLDEGVMGRAEYRGQDRGINNFVV